MEKEEILKAIEQLRKESKKRNFDQSIDLIINLKNFDIKKESINLILTLPYPIKKPKILAFLNKKSKIIDCITKQEIDNYKEKKDIKKLVKEYDFFIAHASLMPILASKFGKYLGPSGKMPSPQLGIIKEEKDEEIKELIPIFERTVKIRTKEPSIKFCVGKESMKDEEIAENIIYSYNKILSSLQKGKEQIKNVLIKFTMSKPIKIK